MTHSENATPALSVGGAGLWRAERRSKPTASQVARRSEAKPVSVEAIAPPIVSMPDDPRWNCTPVGVYRLQAQRLDEENAYLLRRLLELEGFSPEAPEYAERMLHVSGEAQLGWRDMEARINADGFFRVP